jgi:predicted nucleic acid-binding protein
MMKVYCDTSVLVAASISSHPHYAQSLLLLKRVRSGKLEAVISAHGIAEFYAVLTRAPLTPTVHPSEAWRLLTQNILPNFQVAALSAAQYTTVLREAAEKGWTGGLVYDALHLACAASTHCKRIYTFNLRHFHQLAPHLQDTICSP